MQRFEQRPRRRAGAIGVGAAAALLIAASASADLVPPREPSAIIGGDPVGSCEWPSTVFLENCTGTLIHPEIVVYAAHCGEAERVWFAESVEGGVPTPAEGFSVETEYCWLNPDYPAEGIGPFRASDYAFCKLAEPVTEVPIVPALMGCETTVLTSGTPVTLAGFGGTDQDTFGVKFSVDTVLHYIDDFGVAVIGGDGKSPCAGDSGGPAFVQLPDGSWRAFGIVSGPNFGNCGDAMWFPTIYSAIPDIERESGIDVTPCHHGGNGQWNPSPACRDFPIEPHSGTGTSWARGCAGGPTTEWSSTCGPAFDESEDLVAPTAAIISPEDRSRIDVPDGDTTVLTTIDVEASDTVSGVAWVELVVGGTTVPNSRLVGAPWTWNADLAPGVLQLQARVSDWAGNEALTETVVVGIDEDPPEAPVEGTSSGGDEPADDDTSTGNATSTGSEPAEESSTGDTDGDTATAADADSGCGCTSGPSSPLAALWSVGLLGILRRRRDRPRHHHRARVSLLVGCLLPWAGCASEDTDGSAESSTTLDVPTTTGTSGVASTTSTDTTSPSTSSSGESTGVSASTGPSCEVGTLDCTCNSEFTCCEGLACMVNTCIECAAGAITCPCRDEDAEQGPCDEGLLCFSGRCASPQPCPFVESGTCDEPQGTGQCLPGTDTFDCCPTRPGVCEERSQGGPCPDGSDPDDCEADGSTGADTETSDA